MNVLCLLKDLLIRVFSSGFQQKISWEQGCSKKPWLRSGHLANFVVFTAVPCTLSWPRPLGQESERSQANAILVTFFSGWVT